MAARRHKLVASTVMQSKRRLDRANSRYGMFARRNGVGFATSHFMGRCTERPTRRLHIRFLELSSALRMICSTVQAVRRDELMNRPRSSPVQWLDRQLVYRRFRPSNQPARLHRLAAAHTRVAGVNARWFARSLEGGCKVTSRLAGAKEAGALRSCRSTNSACCVEP